MNPYKVLGKEKGDSFEELKARYDELKAIYSEQRFKEGEEGNEGAKKLTELEDAWAMILADCDVKTAEEMGNDYSKVEELIRLGKLTNAQEIMDNVTLRDGKWHYYQSVIYYKRDWMQESKKQLELAIECEPDNQKYKDTLERLVKVMGNPNTNPRNMGAPPVEDPMMTGNCLSNCCMAYCCSELCCSAMRCCG
ncbi:MAG: hypothetical protein IJD07_02880 [Clostridia bacterium]|nr:hypothetical protein [Clostridia bacterium]